MSQLFRLHVGAAACAACLGLSAAAQTSASECEKAWTDYNEFKQHNAMEPSRYPLTVHGAAVRAACGPEALPVPPDTDTPPVFILRKKPKPPEKPKPPKPSTP